MTKMVWNAEAVSLRTASRTSVRLVVMVVRVAVVVVVTMAVAVRTLTGPLGRLSTAWLPQVPAAA